MLQQQNREYEILFIDDGSTDQTIASAEMAASRLPHLRLFRHTAPSGFGACFRTALAHAHHPLLGYAECSRRYQPADFPRLLKWMDRVDLVTGYRVGPYGAHPRGSNDWLYRLVLRILFAIRLRDLRCLYGLARRDIFKNIPIQSNGVFAVAEIVAKANFIGHVMTEVSIRYQALETDMEVGPSRQPWTEMWRMFAHPDFGPPPARPSPAPPST
jgi:glycosyltransferase involved in cell wall biosynthesis